MRRYSLAFVLAVLVASTTGAARPTDPSTLTGVWTGTISIPDRGKFEKAALHATFKHDGPKLTGTVGLNSKAQFDISKGLVEATKFGVSTTFDMPATGFVMHFELRLADNVLRGVARLDNEKAVAPVELQLVK